MQSYRYFFLNRHAHIERAEVIDATSDAEAIARAEVLFAATSTECGGIEVWDQARRIHRVHRVRPEERVDLKLRESPEQIRRWRMRAEELRAAADGFAHGPSRQAFENSAATYEALANATAARLQRRQDHEAEAG